MPTPTRFAPPASSLDVVIERLSLGRAADAISGAASGALFVARSWRSIGCPASLTTSGTISIYIFALFAGTVLGGAYAVGRALLPSNVPIRCGIFVLATTGFLVGTQVFLNREDFAFLPAGLSLALLSATAALTALPVPLLLERLVPDPSRHPNALARLTTATALTAFLAFGLAGVIAAYQVPTLI